MRWIHPCSCRFLNDVSLVRFSEELTTLHENLKNFLQQREQKELELQRRFSEYRRPTQSLSDSHNLDAPSLTLRTSPAYGMHVHLAKKREQGELNKAEAFISIAESGTTKCYFNQVSRLPHTIFTKSLICSRNGPT